MFEIKIRGFEAKGELAGFDPGSEQIYLEFLNKKVIVEVRGLLSPILLKTMTTMGLDKLKKATLDLTDPSKPSISLKS